MLSRLVAFYAALDAWRRDIDRWQMDPPDTLLDQGDVRTMARRLGETLEPALAALEALDDYVPDHEEIDRRLEATHEGVPPEGWRQDLRDMARLAKESKDAETQN